MHVIVERDALAPALDAVSKVAGKANVIPILAHVLLEAEGDTLRICAHRLDFWMRLEIKAEVKKAAAVTVPADALRAIVKGVAAGAQIALSLKSGKLQVVAGRARYTLGTLPASGFPPMLDEPDADGRVGLLTLSAADARTLLDRPAFAAGGDDSRQFFDGVFLCPREDRLWGMASNGYRLFATSIPAPAGADMLPLNGERPGVILPKYALDGIVQALESGGKLLVDESKFIAQGPRITFSGKYLDLAYPDMWRVLPPRDCAHRAVMDRTEFQQAMARLATVASKKDRDISLSWTEGEEELRLSSSNVEKGAGEEFVRLYEPATGSHSARCHADHLMEAARALQGEALEYAADASINAWVTDPNDGTILSCVAEMKPKSAEAVDDAA